MEGDTKGVHRCYNTGRPNDPYWCVCPCQEDTGNTNATKSVEDEVSRPDVEGVVHCKDGSPRHTGRTDDRRNEKNAGRDGDRCSLFILFFGAQLSRLVIDFLHYTLGKHMIEM